MAAIRYSPYIPNIQAWVDYFKHQPKEYKKFYTIGRPKHKGEDMEAIKLVTPTEQVVDQAKSAVKRERDIEDTFKASKKPACKKRKRVGTKSSSKKKRKV